MNKNYCSFYFSNDNELQISLFSTGIILFWMNRKLFHINKQHKHNDIIHQAGKNWPVQYFFSKIGMHQNAVVTFKICKYPLFNEDAGNNLISSFFLFVSHSLFLWLFPIICLMFIFLGGCLQKHPEEMSTFFCLF